MPGGETLRALALESRGSLARFKLSGECWLAAGQPTISWQERCHVGGFSRKFNQVVRRPTFERPSCHMWTPRGPPKAGNPEGDDDRPHEFGDTSSLRDNQLERRASTNRSGSTGANSNTDRSYAEGTTMRRRPRSPGGKCARCGGEASGHHRWRARRPHPRHLTHPAPQEQGHADAPTGAGHAAPRRAAQLFVACGERLQRSRLDGVWGQRHCRFFPAVAARARYCADARRCQSASSRVRRGPSGTAPGQPPAARQHIES
jgi:hypothetical protein